MESTRDERQIYYHNFRAAEILPTLNARGHAGAEVSLARVRVRLVRPDRAGLFAEEQALFDVKGARTRRSPSSLLP